MQENVGKRVTSLVTDVLYDNVLLSDLDCTPSSTSAKPCDDDDSLKVFIISY